MLPTFDVVMSLLGIVGLVGLMAVAYGALTRAFAAPSLSQALLGAVFGGVAVLAMVDPIHVAPGVIADLRSVPLVLAGAFLGLPGAAVATLMALAARIALGGEGTMAGSTAIVLVALIGLAWTRWLRRPGHAVRNVLA